MPNQTFLRAVSIAERGQHTLHNGLSTQILLIAADNLDFATGRCRGKYRVEAIDVDQSLRSKQVPEVVLHVVQGSVMTLLVGEPRAPFVRRKPYTAILQLFAFGGKAQDVGYKHLRNAPLVLKHVVCPIGPRHLRPHGSLGLADDHGNAVDEEHQIETLSSVAALPGKLPLIGHHAMVLGRILAEEADVDVIAVFAERLRILLEEQPAESVIGLNQLILRVSAHDGRSQLVDDLCSLVGRNPVQSDQCILQPRLYQYGVRRAGNVVACHILPAALGSLGQQHFFNRILFVEYHGFVVL